MRTAAAVIAAMLVASPAAAAPKKAPADAKSAADRFSLDLAPVEEDSTVTASSEATPASAPAASTDAAPAAPATAASTARFSLDTPIVDLLGNYQSKKVLDRDMPGLSTDKNLAQFKALSLNRLAPMSGGRLSPALLEKVGKHLAEIE